MPRFNSREAPEELIQQQSATLQVCRGDTVDVQQRGRENDHRDAC